MLKYLSHLKQNGKESNNLLKDISVGDIPSKCAQPPSALMETNICMKSD